MSDIQFMYFILLSSEYFLFSVYILKTCFTVSLIIGKHFALLCLALKFCKVEPDPCFA